ncbi:uncharacterized protein LOC124133723 [Haliotis rufescens]|uniref:uncharacterized protein LOC124133723 n=1 Tax=Haliotis rufescens TaxID=6454 RepID=UPI00201E82B9|nr:uncharacterized protein LOC124133723 [Haliotis rufescens]
MFQLKLSKVTEDSADTENSKPSSETRVKTTSVERKSRQNSSRDHGYEKTRQSVRTLPPLKGKVPPSKWPHGRASISEGIKPPRKQTASEADSQSALDPRRASVPLPKQSGKTMFAGLGRKVTSMVRARLAFQGDNKKRDEIMNSNTMEAIHEMPKAPRFSSFLSPEAQYAMMMGYEDVLHHQLSMSHPEYRSVLRRNKTPMIRMGIVKLKHGKIGASRTSLAVGDGGGDSDPETEATPAPPEVDEDDMDEMCRADSPSRKTMAPSATNTSTLFSQKTSLRKSKAQMIPLDRRLELTYRMESAMDILDTLRRHHGQPPISPRVRLNKRAIAPIRDYNSWTNVWKREFSQSDRRHSPKFKV